MTDHVVLDLLVEANPVREVPDTVWTESDADYLASIRDRSPRMTDPMSPEPSSRGSLLLVAAALALIVGVGFVLLTDDGDTASELAAPTTQQVTSTTTPVDDWEETEIFFFAGSAGQYRTGSSFFAQFRVDLPDGWARTFQSSPESWKCPLPQARVRKPGPSVLRRFADGARLLPVGRRHHSRLPPVARCCRDHGAGAGIRGWGRRIGLQHVHRPGRRHHSTAERRRSLRHPARTGHLGVRPGCGWDPCHHPGGQPNGWGLLPRSPTGAQLNRMAGAAGVTSGSASPKQRSSAHL